ncbi:MAG: ribonuclease H-like domain-containing protein [Nanoarchaeota archaeon]
MRLEQKWQALARETNGIVHTREAYLEVTKGLFEIEHGKILKHLEQYRLQLPSHYSDKLVCLMDIENCGLPYSSPINTVSIGSINGEFKVKTFFALDYSGEREILKRAWKIMRRADKVFSYNGKAFDMPRLLSRIKTHGLLVNGQSPIEKSLGGRHCDLYPIFKEMTREKGITLLDRKLQTLEQVLFNTFRGNEIHGADIPKAYHDFVYTSNEESISRMATIVNHNTLDVASLGACLEFLRQQGKEVLKDPINEGGITLLDRKLKTLEQVLFPILYTPDK